MAVTDRSKGRGCGRVAGRGTAFPVLRTLCACAWGTLCMSADACCVLQRVDGGRDDWARVDVLR